MGTFIKFLGTAGARIVVSKQIRASGGIWFQHDKLAFFIDPGPGALVKALTSKPKLEPWKLSAILLSHRHIDHANDLNIMVESMTEGNTKKRGMVFLPKDALQEERVLFSYLTPMLQEIVLLEEGKEYKIGNLRFATPCRHWHSVETYGFKFYLGENLTASFITDTLYNPKLEEAYQNSDLLVINMVRLKPDNTASVMHLNAANVEELVTSIRPKMAVITHFGMQVILNKPWKIAEEISQKTGVQVIAARDGMQLDLESIIQN
jgi:ribonuclease BN (tRNA processing enzyme)